MTRKMGVRWHLREVMATRDMFSTTDLIAPLAERGVELSREQVYRLVTQQPERLNVYTLAALCDLLDCQGGDLIEPVVEQRAQRKRRPGLVIRARRSGCAMGCDPCAPGSSIRTSRRKPDRRAAPGLRASGRAVHRLRGQSQRPLVSHPTADLCRVRAAAAHQLRALRS